MLRHPSRSGSARALVLSLLFACFLTGCKETAYVGAPFGLTLRTAPQADADRVAVLTVGSEVIVLESDGPVQTIDGRTAAWNRVRYREQEGWVFSADLLGADQGAIVERIRRCVERGGDWHEERCYDRYLYEMTRNQTIHDPCRPLTITLRPNRTVVAQYGDSPAAVAGDWRYENGDRIVVTLRCRAGGDCATYVPEVFHILSRPHQQIRRREAYVPGLDDPAMRDEQGWVWYAPGEHCRP